MSSMGWATGVHHQGIVACIVFDPPQVPDKGIRLSCRGLNAFSKAVDGIGLHGGGGAGHGVVGVASGAASPGPCIK